MYTPPAGNAVAFNHTGSYTAPAGDGAAFDFLTDIVRIISDIMGTLRSSFRIAKATFDAAGVTAARTLTLPDATGTLALAAQTVQHPAGRVTLESGVAVSTTDQLAKTSVFYTPCAGELVPIYNGTVWTPTVFTELTLALATSGTGFQVADTNYDLFVVSDAGTLRLGTGSAWSTAIVRGTGAGTTELERKNGLWTNKVSMTLRWGSASGNTITVAANQGTYVGTMRATANGQCEDSLAKRFLWNTYNRALRALRRIEQTDTWTYSTATIRQTNANADNRVEVVHGLAEDAVNVAAYSNFVNDLSTFRSCSVGVGVDSTTVFSGLILQMGASSTSGGGPTGVFDGSPGLGYHALNWLERGHGLDVQTWRGDAAVDFVQTGLRGVALA